MYRRAPPIRIMIHSPHRVNRIIRLIIYTCFQIGFPARSMNHPRNHLYWHLFDLANCYSDSFLIDGDDSLGRWSWCFASLSEIIGTLKWDEHSVFHDNRDANGFLLSISSRFELKFFVCCNLWHCFRTFIATQYISQKIFYSIKYISSSNLMRFLSSFEVTIDKLASVPVLIEAINRRSTLRAENTQFSKIEPFHKMKVTRSTLFA